ncbi:glycosyltransferase [Neorhizobium lilium]|uniref:Glycosyltransferase n=1 Tax=Neorhizobium lilium TaxID=2503024 RepID=A0A3S3U373_9HYPH|nr:glycosyltransferase [Neorhizobium lilium]RWX80900.1 glycosyltransferase [Neorhizobium lilium]
MAAIDVVVPNYNYGKYLRTCVESVLNQADVAIRVLIIDNASTDDSRDIAHSLAQDERVELILRESNAGTHASFNEGIDWAQNDYFLLLFSDDFLVPGALKRATDIMEQNSAIAFCYGRDVAVHGDDPVPIMPGRTSPVAFRLHKSRAFIESFCRRAVFQIPGSSVVVRTEVQKRAGHYRTTLPHSDDYEIWLRLAMLGPVAELDAVQVGLRTHDSNRSREFAARQLEHILHTAAAAESFFNHEGGSLEDCGALRRLARQGVVGRAYWSGIAHLLRGDMEAMRLLGFAIRSSPVSAVVPPVSYLMSRPDLAGRISSFFANSARSRHIVF